MTTVIQKARDLRKRMTPEETEFWRFLRDRRFTGYKFRRQHPIGQYIADFCCPEKRLVIELDGEGHDISYDELRDAYLKARRYQVIRIKNDDFQRGRDQILLKVLNLLES